ncbi:winged helix-turn-helix domain-containing protein [Paraburkholderia sp. BCC1884]|uniref:winged helix-turn-helix domain-containing protein n=1 Tax=Paraburkholderia sp. BCC1884 TaxID=2562668 RepID=UPI001183BF65|nr:winged helix-turn-helix domain-containing protein [Paraburkholderia sp. BCC1884]
MIKIGRITVSLEMREVYEGGQLLQLGSRAFGILELLIGAGGKTVTKDEIFRHVWPDSVVGENNIHVQLSALRKIFGDGAQAIRTISGRGYRLTLAPESVDPAAMLAADTPAAGTSAAGTPVVARAPAPVPYAGGGPNGLPVCHAPLIGRDDTIAEVARALDDTSIVTLLGPGGIGKTQLGIAIARSIANASGMQVCFITLASVAREQSIVGAVADALGVTRGEGTSDVELRSIAAAIHGRKLLVLLDNCEHVIESAATVCDALLQASAELRILVTSREPLRTRGEKSYWVNALDVPAAGAGSQEILACGSVELFLDQLNALNATATIDRAGLDMIATICRRLDGVPLAIELAAARAAVFGIRKLVSELDDRFQFLTGGRRTAPRRQQTLEASLDWGYALLNESEKTVLHRLGVFPTRFSLEAVCAVATSDQLSRNEVTEAIVGLASKSFIMTTCDSRTKEYFLLETCREYALRRLYESDDADEVLARKAVLDASGQAGPGRTFRLAGLAAQTAVEAFASQ